MRKLAAEEGAGQRLGRRQVGRGGKFGAAEVWGVPLSAGSLRPLPSLESGSGLFGRMHLTMGLSYLVIGVFPADPAILSIRLISNTIQDVCSEVCDWLKKKKKSQT